MGGRLRALILVAALIGLGVLAGSALSQWWGVPAPGSTRGPAQAAAAAARGGRATAPARRIRVEVLNAAGRANLARSATDALREVGFDVVYFGNADAFDRDTSVVLDRVGDLAGARAVADALGIRAVRSEPDSNLFVDVSVLLGGVWELPPEAAPPAPEPRWWDLRRFAPREEQPQREPAGVRPAGAMANPPGEAGDQEREP